MGKTPCCEKMGLKKGPWTKEEDHILINYINRHGHGNWRTLPKLAGLSRCGKSCRLRWTNYLKPGIKRGNFSKEEEDTIFKLHQTLGNRWSLIAATLPGRTDNEIKNVWNTHLKKRLQHCSPSSTKQQQQEDDDDQTSNNNISDETLPEADGHKFDHHHHHHQLTNLPNPNTSTILDLDHDQDFWSDQIIHHSYHSEGDSEHGLMFPHSQGLQHQELDYDLGLNTSSSTEDGMDFWSDLFTLE